MPIYIPKKQTGLASPALSENVHDNQDDFLLDPDQRWDKLPQPFRFIDKLLSRVLDDVWEIIDSREVERVREATRIRPPHYQCSIQAPQVYKFINNN